MCLACFWCLCTQKLTFIVKYCLSVSLQAEVNWRTWGEGRKDRFSNSGCGLKEAIHPPIHHSSTAPACLGLLDEIVIRGRAGWIDEYDDVPRRRSTLSPIGLSAACCSPRSRCYDITVSLWKAIKGVCMWVGGDGKGRKGFDSSSISNSAKGLKEKYQRTCKSLPLPWQNIRLFSNLFTETFFVGSLN